MTVNDAIRTALETWGQHPCFAELRPGRPSILTSAAQSRREISELALQLHSWGVRPRQLVPIFLENSTNFIHAFLSLLELNAIPVLVKLDYRRMELEQVFANCRPQAVISERRHLPLLKPYLQGLTVVEHSDGRFSLGQSADTPLPAPGDIPEDIASINYTYRGYGYPLGAMVSHAQYLHGASVLQHGLKGLRGEKMLVILPMAHIFTLVGCILVPILYQMTSVIACTLHPRHLFKYIEEMQIDYITSVPEIYEMLHRLRESAVNLSSLKVFVSGGSLLTPDSYSKISRAFSVDLLHGYGLTEFTPISRNVRLQARAGTVGSVGHDIACRICSPDASGVGEIQIRTQNVSQGYYRRPEESGEAFQDGWFRTGDSGRLDQEHLVFVRELKQTRKINGNIVDLEEVRRAILMDREVAECQVSCENSCLSTRLGVGARVDFKEKVQETRTRLRALLAEYKIPRQFSRL